MDFQKGYTNLHSQALYECGFVILPMLTLSILHFKISDNFLPIFIIPLVAFFYL